jgi:HTH-type transcriptional regulator/antitoxin HigA
LRTALPTGTRVLHIPVLEEDGLTQPELPETGTQGVESKILSGRRSLNARRIANLAKRFMVSPAVFLEAED